MTKKIFRYLSCFLIFTAIYSCTFNKSKTEHNDEDVKEDSLSSKEKIIKKIHNLKIPYYFDPFEDNCIGKLMWFDEILSEEEILELFPDKEVIYFDNSREKINTPYFKFNTLNDLLVVGTVWYDYKSNFPNPIVILDLQMTTKKGDKVGPIEQIVLIRYGQEETLNAFATINKDGIFYVAKKYKSVRDQPDKFYNESHYVYNFTVNGIEKKQYK